MDFLAKEEKNYLDQIIQLSMDTYNYYDKLMVLDTIGKANSSDYIQNVKMIKDNHRVEKSLFNLLDIRSKNKLKQCNDYAIQEFAKYKFHNNGIKNRVLFQLEATFQFFDLSNGLGDNNRKELYKCFIICNIIKSDYDMVYISELKKISNASLGELSKLLSNDDNALRKILNDNINKGVLLSKQIYSFIFQNFALEEELLNKKFKFNKYNYIYGNLRLQLIEKFDSVFMFADNIYKLYETYVMKYCMFYIISASKDLKANHSFIGQLDFISHLIACFVLLNIHSLDELKDMGFAPLMERDFGKYFEIAFERYKEGQTHYKRLSFIK